MRADESTHVLDDPKYSDICLSTEADLLSHIKQSNFLRGCHYDGSFKISLLQVLDNRDVFIRGSRRGINDQIVKIFPDHISEELLNEAILLWTSPDDSICLAGKHEPN